jgi:sigma54-dependent transcription regulator
VRICASFAGQLTQQDAVPNSGFISDESTQQHLAQQLRCWQLMHACFFVLLSARGLPAYMMQTSP